MLFIYWDVAPQIVTLRFSGLVFPLTWYGLLFSVSFLVGQRLVFYIFSREGKPAGDVERLTLYLAVATVVGARVGHFLFYEWELLFASPRQWLTTLVTPPFAGLASHGATICILLALYWYAQKTPGQPFFWVVDRMVIPAALAGALIRLGNWFNSEIYGIPTQLPWGVVFLREQDPDLLPLVPRHPTQLYESVWCLGLLALTFYLWKYKRAVLPNGFITGVFLVLLFGFRLLVEFLKNNQATFEAGMLFNMGQLLSIPPILLGLLLLRKTKPTLPAKALPIQ